MKIARAGFLVLIAATLMVAVSGVTGQAIAAPKASIVMDLRNGEVLRARSADRRLHPASLTKMMTVYLTFQAVRDGRLRLDQKVRVSRHAARQPASKLYLRAGQRVSVRSLIRATAIKSANDAAMVLAEAIGGSQKKFAQMMTREARRLGMKNTAFKNPHGLTQRGHYSTARDMALMGRHLFFDYPQYYNIFKRRSEFAAGKRIWNTNRLLSTYRGADGIKTGYTRAAGYNLVATAKRGHKHVIAVQFGASSSGDRARRVARLLDIGFSRAKSRVKRVKPAGAKRAQLRIASAPVPVARPGSPGATRLAALAEALGPSRAAAAVPDTSTATRNAPQRAELPRTRPGAPTPAPVLAAVLVIDGVRYPMPTPRPVRLAGSGQGAWAARFGPFRTESEALVTLAELSDQGVAKDAQISKAPAGARSPGYLVQALRPTETDAAVLCGSVGRLTQHCNVERLTGAGES